MLALRRALLAPFGFALRAARDAPLRAAAIGMPVQRLQWTALVLSGAAAGLAGGLYAFSKGSISTESMAVGKSVDALVMVLLGGVQTLSGPIIGALAFTGLHEQLVRLTEYWRLVLGLVIIALVLFFPQGLAGAARDRWEARRGHT